MFGTHSLDCDVALMFIAAAEEDISLWYDVTAEHAEDAEMANNRVRLVSSSRSPPSQL